ncbi:MAG: hypothetical protein ACRCWJ_00125 [Casimicrobium sp.]
MPTQLNQAILFVDDGLDTAATDALCKTLRQDNAQVFVLKGGARAWQAHTQKLSEAQRIQGAELSLIDAARWFDDTNTEMVTVDNTTVNSTRTRANAIAQQSSIRESKQVRRIVLVAPEQYASAQSILASLVDDRTWWVRATRSMLESQANETRVVALQKGMSLNKPCGVN